MGRGDGRVGRGTGKGEGNGRGEKKTGRGDEKVRGGRSVLGRTKSQG